MANSPNSDRGDFGSSSSAEEYQNFIKSLDTPEVPNEKQPPTSDPNLNQATSQDSEIPYSLRNRGSKIDGLNTNLPKQSSHPPP
jgi:hypothetical protein